MIFDTFHISLFTSVGQEALPLTELGRALGHLFLPVHVRLVPPRYLGMMLLNFSDQTRIGVGNMVWLLFFIIHF